MKHWADDDKDPMQTIWDNLGISDSEDYWYQMQVPGLQQRRAEVELILQVIEDFKPDIYLELGAGSGRSLEIISEKFPGIQTIGFEINGHENKFLGLRIRDIFTNETREEISSIFDSDKVILTHCDGGNKIRELFMISMLMKSGSIILTHDYGVEVKKDQVAFLNKFEVLKRYESWINKHLCLQQVWRKP